MNREYKVMGICDDNVLHQGTLDECVRYCEDEYGVGWSTMTKIWAVCHFLVVYAGVRGILGEFSDELDAYKYAYECYNNDIDVRVVELTQREYDASIKFWGKDENDLNVLEGTTYE